MNVSQVVVGYFEFVKKDLFKTELLLLLFTLSTVISLGLIITFSMSVGFYLFLCSSYVYLAFIMLKKLNTEKEKLKSLDESVMEAKLSNYAHLLDKKVSDAYVVDSLKRADSQDIELIVADDFDESNFITSSGSYIRPNKSLYYLKKRFNCHYFLVPLAYIILGSMNLIFNTFGLGFLIGYF